MIEILPEAGEHAAGVYAVELAAFGRAGEADLCVSLRERGVATLSLVAVEDGQVAGHVLFSPVTLRGEDGRELAAAGMGPVAVLPARQRQGIGSRLIQAGLDEIRHKGGAEAVVVLGDPGYYSRFGFEPAGRYGVRFQDPGVPPEDFMLIELTPGALREYNGTAYYEPEFSTV